MNEIPRWRSALGWAMCLFVCLGITASGMAKLMKAQPLIDFLKQVNLQDHIVTIGIIELTCVAIYLFPKTSNIGFFLLCSYIGGIIATEWSVGGASIGVTLAVVFYVGNMLKKPELSGLNI